MHEDHPKYQKMKSLGLLVMRLVLAAVFIKAGYGKLFATPGIEVFAGDLSNLGVPAPMVMAYVIGLVELLGGIALLLGWMTKVAGLALAVIMLGAYFMTKDSFDAGRLDLALAALAFGVAMIGSGKFAIPCRGKKKMMKEEGGDMEK